MIINLKWNKTQYDNVDFDPALGVANLKTIIQNLTAVPPERQKLMAKGAWIGMLKDSADLTLMPIKTGHQVMLMGTADVVEKCAVKTVFVEDMTVAEKAKAGALVPAGLGNLGNTCYMNSTLQVMRGMTDLREAWKTVRPGSGSNPQSSGLTCQLRDTMNTLDAAGSSIAPMGLVNYIRTNYPQYAQQGDNGGYLQQDAEEFFNSMMQALSHSMEKSPTSSASSTSGLDDFFTVELEEEVTCQETTDEPMVVHKEKVNKIVCNIQGSIGGDAATLTPVNLLDEGLKLGFEGTLEKNSQVLGRNALWNKRQRISKLPKFICVQFMRFFWKATPGSRDHQGVKCKIMRPVIYSEVFNVLPYCTDKLQKKLSYNREQEELLRADSLSVKRPKTEATEAVVTSSSSGDSSAMDVEGAVDDEDAVLKAALIMSLGEEGAAAADAPPPAAESSSSSAPPAPPALGGVVPDSNALGGAVPDNFTGNYELMGVVTHKGRTADSGHYIGWVRQAEKSDRWWKFDDDTVTEIASTAEILGLKGGGDWHTAYMNFYRYIGK